MTDPDRKSGFVRLLRVAAALTLPLGLAAAAAAQSEPIYRGALMGGFGGSFLSDGKHDPDHSAIQATFGILTDERTFTVFRVGRLSLDDEIVGGRLSPDLEYANVAGEYRMLSRSYTWGMFAGLGGYRLTGEPVTASSRSETGVGVTLGVNGDFDFTRHFGLAIELAGHYVFFDDPDVYGVGLVGVAIHF